MRIQITLHGYTMWQAFFYIPQVNIPIDKCYTSGLASTINGAKTKLPLQKEITGIAFRFSSLMISAIYQCENSL